MNHIRNFLITAHVDHGKSTLADRMLEMTGTIAKRLMKPQYLGQLELERERGITIKMAPVRMSYTLNAILYTLNLIDTPGHSDFSYEVSRALAAVEGAILLVDATQGIQAQTLANFEQARRAGLAIIGAVNKIDAATPEQIEETVRETSRLLGVPTEEILKVSGKTGEGAEALLEAVIERVPPPISNSESTANKRMPHSQFVNSQQDSLLVDVPRALIFDSLYDDHKGVLAFVRIFDNEFRAGEVVRLLATRRDFKTKEVGYFSPQLRTCDVLNCGEIGYIATGIKDPNVLKIGDTVVGNAASDMRQGKGLALPGYQEPNPVVFVSFYPEDASKYDELKQALAKLHLTDAALHIEPDMSEVLGRGFKGGFLGRLHFEIAAERLAREFGVKTVHSFPSVAYRVKNEMRRAPSETARARNAFSSLTGHALWTEITNPKDFPDAPAEVEEPMAKVEMVAPPHYRGAILSLKEFFRLSAIETQTLEHKIVISAKLPLADLIRDFDDKLKSATQGFASMSYEIADYQRADVAKLDTLVAGHLVPGLSRILPREDIEREGRATVEKLKELLPRQVYAQALQAMVRGRVIARETIPALRKDVTGYLYGGDRSRKMKLWKKQQRGKAKLKERAAQSAIAIPPRVFKELLKR